jgi:hypothetical protein
MKKSTRSVVLTIVLLLGLPAAAGSEPVEGANADPNTHVPLVGPTGTCTDYTASGVRVGHAKLTAKPTDEAPGFRTVEVTVHVHKLPPLRTYEVWLAHVTVADGEILGCAATFVGTFTTTRGGSGHLTGTATRFSMPFAFPTQLWVTPSFHSLEAYSTPPFTYAPAQ